MITIRTGAGMVGPATPAGAMEEAMGRAMEEVMEGTEAPEAAAAEEEEVVVEAAEADILGT